ncbi:UNVERIFIED_CONTAM: hypothetical protein GTU68_036025 [Idotea baltica]|nr:hypothetical protein [Idotea baltica]
MNILVTGGAGFIGSHLIRRFVKQYPNYNIINFDALTYAGNLINLKDIEKEANYQFVKGDITQKSDVENVLEAHKINAVIHLAAESHVDRSILGPMHTIETNIIGTAVLLQAVFNYWKTDLSDKLFYHVSTDEVYGTLGKEGFFTEETAYDPRSPYSASKASSDHLVRAYQHTYELPIKISNCSNNYGAFQFPEKLLPLFIHNIVESKPLPVYGDGKYTRDWLWVEDHAAAIDVIFHKGKLGETYNIGGWNEWQNIDLIHLLCEKMDAKLGREKGESAKAITFVKDRAGHDKRYAIDATKLDKELNWKPSIQFEEGLDKTIDWYLDNKEWLNAVTSGDYRKYYDQQYAER